MCGKFTAMVSWGQIVAYSEMFTKGDGGDGQGGEDGGDEIITFRVGGPLPVIVWDAEARQRRVVRMRWGFPDPRDWRRPRPIHARSETVDTTKAFSQAFADGQRGIVLMKRS